MISIDSFSALLQYAVDAGVELAPLALEQALLFQAPDQRIQGAISFWNFDKALSIVILYYQLSRN